MPFDQPDYFPLRDSLGAAKITRLIAGERGGMDPKFDRLAYFFFYVAIGIFLSALVYRILPEPFDWWASVGVFLVSVLLAQIKFRFFR